MYCILDINKQIYLKYLSIFLNNYDTKNIHNYKI